MEEATLTEEDKESQQSKENTITINPKKTEQESVLLEEGERKLSDLLQKYEITAGEYLDRYSDRLRWGSDEINTLGDIDNDILMYLLSEYFKPASRDGRPGFPTIAKGHVRLFRGEQPRGEDEEVISFEGQGRWWTQFLDIAADYAEGEDGKIYFLDVPETIAQDSIISRVHEDLDRPVGGGDAFIFEFYIPSEHVGEAKGIQNTLDPQTVDTLLNKGEFTRFGDDPRTEYEDLPDTQKERGNVRSRLINLSADAILSFWDSYTYDHNPDFRQKHPDRENYQKPKYPNSIESAEYLLAKISGWK